MVAQQTRLEPLIGESAASDPPPLPPPGGLWFRWQRCRLSDGAARQAEELDRRNAAWDNPCGRRLDRDRMRDGCKRKDMCDCREETEIETLTG